MTVRLRNLGLLSAVALLLAACSGTGGLGGTDTRFISGDGQVATVSAADRGAPIDLKGPLLVDKQGQTSLDVRTLRGRVVVLNLWASWCGPCRTEAPALQRIAANWAARGVAVVGINIRDQNAAATAYIQRFDITFPSVVDPDGALLLSFRGDLPANAIPTTLVLDREGRPAARILGPTAGVGLEQMLTPIVAERP